MSDVIVVGAGIVGLAHALAAVRAGARVTVVDRDARANGASIRNFGFITVTGQEQGRVWRLARRSAAIWRNVAPAAGIRIDQEGLLVVGQRPGSSAVLDAFMATEMGDGCQRLNPSSVADLCPQAHAPAGAILSTHDLRVESRFQRRTGGGAARLCGGGDGDGDQAGVAHVAVPVGVMP